MDAKSVESLRRDWADKGTDELLEIWKENDDQLYSDSAFEAAQQILIERGSEIPPQKPRGVERLMLIEQDIGLPAKPVAQDKGRIRSWTHGSFLFVILCLASLMAISLMVWKVFLPGLFDRQTRVSVPAYVGILLVMCGLPCMIFLAADSRRRTGRVNWPRIAITLTIALVFVGFRASSRAYDGKLLANVAYEAGGMLAALAACWYLFRPTDMRGLTAEKQKEMIDGKRRLTAEQQKEMIDEKRQKAEKAFSEGGFAEAIRAWKELLPQVPEQSVRDILPKIRAAYNQTTSGDGLAKLSTVEGLYADWFYMSRRLGQLDAKARTTMQSLAQKIRREVSKLPEEIGNSPLSDEA